MYIAASGFKFLASLSTNVRNGRQQKREGRVVPLLSLFASHLRSVHSSVGGYEDMYEPGDSGTEEG